MIEQFRRFLNEVPEKKGLSAQGADYFYSHGFALYNGGNVPEALEVFEVLSAQRPLESRNWVAFASSLQELKEYERALRGWAMAAILDDSNAYPHFYAAQCHLSLGQKEEANTALSAAAKRAATEELQDKIKLLKEQWNLS